MKFYTRELYRRSQSRDEAVLNVADEEWELTNQRYEQHVQAIEPHLPAHLREFTELLLHDAQVQSISQHGELLLMVLRKDIPPRDMVFLSYHLEASPIIEPFVDHPTDWSKPTDFQFDEFDLVQDTGHTIYTQSIVFGNGWLMRLRFRDVTVRLAQPMYPVTVEGAVPMFQPIA